MARRIPASADDPSIDIRTGSTCTAVNKEQNEAARIINTVRLKYGKDEANKQEERTGNVYTNAGDASMYIRRNTAEREQEKSRGPRPPRGCRDTRRPAKMPASPVLDRRIAIGIISSTYCIIIVLLNVVTSDILHLEKDNTIHIIMANAHLRRKTTSLGARYLPTIVAPGRYTVVTKAALDNLRSTSDNDQLKRTKGEMAISTDSKAEMPSHITSHYYVTITSEIKYGDRRTKADVANQREKIGRAIRVTSVSDMPRTPGVKITGDINRLIASRSSGGSTRTSTRRRRNRRTIRAVAIRRLSIQMIMVREKVGEAYHAPAAT